MNKTQTILEYLKKYPDEGPTDLAERMNKEVSGLDVTKGLVSNIKSTHRDQLGLQKGKRGGRRKKVVNLEYAATPPTPAPVPQAAPPPATGNGAGDMDVVGIVSVVKGATQKLGKQHLKELLVAADELGKGKLLELADML